MKLGEAFKNLNPGSPDHLWFVVSNPIPVDGAVIVNLSSHRDGCEETCIVVQGEHRFVKTRSIVAYRYVTMLPWKAYQLLKQSGWYEPWPDASPALLRKIQEGALVSENVAPKFRALIQASITSP